MTTSPPPQPAERGTRRAPRGPNPTEGRNTQEGDERRKEIDSRPTKEEEGKRGAECTGETKPTRANNDNNKKHNNNNNKNNNKPQNKK